MKHTLLILGAGLLVFATSCSNDKDEDIRFTKSSIAFTASVPYAQKDRSVITTENIREFTVYGYVDNELYMDALNVTRTGSGWTYSPTYYWPEGASVDFYSYSPAGVANMGTLLTANGDFRIENYVNDGKTDFIYAVNKGERADNASGTARQVKVNFRHALAKVAVQFTKRANTGNFKFYVRNVRLVNALSQGNFKFPNKTTSADLRDDDNTGDWSDLSSFSGASLNETLVGPVTAQSAPVAANSTGYMFVIPQDITEYNANVPNSGGIYLEIECQFQNAESDHIIWPTSSVTGQTADGFANIRIPVRKHDNDEWDSGHSYVYTISLDVPEEGSTKITFDVTVDNYEDYGNTLPD